MNKSISKRKKLSNEWNTVMVANKIITDEEITSILKLSGLKGKKMMRASTEKWWCHDNDETHTVLTFMVIV